jgi:hypothetical protein
MAVDNSKFHGFSLLPYELRARIWTEHLENATPLVYRFKIRYNLRSRVKSGWIYDCDLYHYNAQPDDVVILEPGGSEIPFLRITASEHRRTLASSTLASRTTLATCSESRQLATRLLPDSLPFRILPPRWTDEMENQESLPDGTGYPEYVLRFNGARDIIIFHANWEDQEAVINISKLGGPPASFSQMQHIGLTIGSFDYGHGDTCNIFGPSYGISRDECRCLTDDCTDACQLEPLPRFLACFPSLQSFYIARISNDGADYGDVSESVWTRLADASCHCEPRSESSEPKHVWPTIKSADIDRLCVVWDERTGCFPTHYLIDVIRQGWRSHFPYYQALEHLNIRFLRRLDPEVEPSQV